MTPYYDHAGIQIYHGDCRDILPHITADVVVTDPPYGIRVCRHGTVGGSNAATAKDYGPVTWDDKPIDADMISLILGCSEKTIIWGGNYFSLPPSPSWLVWDKQNTGNFSDCELAWSNVGGAVRIIRHLWNGMIRAGKEDRFHPTQKPVAVMAWCLSFVPTGTILDPFMGSGTTLVAAKQLGRKAIGIEIEERYCEIAAKRLAQEVLPLEPGPEPKQTSMLGESC